MMSCIKPIKSLKLANKERDSALSEAKLLEDEKNNFIEMLKSFIKDGKLSPEDLSLFGVIL